ncbi:MAG: acyl carrier protein [Gemmobacter sp.]|nr:acyl carrier protein [Gemmobacter sp.]
MQQGSGASIEDRVIAILAAQLRRAPSEIGILDRPEDLGLDSLGLVESIFAIEEAFDISVPFNANEPGRPEFDISSVGAIVAAVERLVARQAA